MEKVLITGGAGYLGSVTAEHLLNNGYDVDVLDNLIFKQLSLLHVLHNKNFNLIQKDVTDFEHLARIVRKYDIIIPLAAIVGAPACDRNKELATKVNTEQIKVIVDNLRDDQKLLVPNTNSQYGHSMEIITEESPFKPLSHYAITKCAAEDYVMKNGNGICFRLATVFGSSPRMRIDLLVNDFVYRAMSSGYLVLFQSHFIRNYIHVRDIANTFLFAIENYEKMRGEVYNVGLSSANLTKMELSKKIKDFIPNLVIVENEFTEDYDGRNYNVSNKKLESLGWKPEYTIEDGILELMEANKMIINHNNRSFTNV